MAETEIIAGFFDLLTVPLNRQQRLDVLRSMARDADWLAAEDVLLAAALLDHAFRSRVDGHALTVEQVAEIQAAYVEALEADADPDVARILTEALEVRLQRPAFVN
jgi:hypothetical protein